MKKNRPFTLLSIGIAIVLTCAALAFSSGSTTVGIQPDPEPGKVIQSKNGVVTLSGHLTQNKIFSGSSGIFSLALTMTADEVAGGPGQKTPNVDMVMVLDRSGSMEGPKLAQAKQAVLDLLSRLGPKDRFALVTYSDQVLRHSDLVPVSHENYKWYESLIQEITAEGSTNLGGGLEQGMALLTSAPKTGNIGRVILISDGQANRGLVDPDDLGRLASRAISREFAVSTVGVGLDFNEHLMTTIADRGTGNYYYLENPRDFARIFAREFNQTRVVAATAVEIRVPLQGGLMLTDAAGFPVTFRDGLAIFHPGDLMSGKERKIFLSFSLPTGQEKEFFIDGLKARYLHQGKSYEVTLAEPFRVACVKDRSEATASIVKKEWEQKILQEDYSKLKADVAGFIKAGDHGAAMDKIREYDSSNRALNDQIGSAAVQSNLDRDLEELRATVTDSFEGAPGEVEIKQKANSKALQHNGYEKRRGKVY